MKSEPVVAFILAGIFMLAGGLVGDSGEPTAIKAVLGAGLLGAGLGVVIWLFVSPLVRWIEWRWRRTRELERLAERLGLP